MSVRVCDGFGGPDCQCGDCAYERLRLQNETLQKALDVCDYGRKEALKEVAKWEETCRELERSYDGVVDKLTAECDRLCAEIERLRYDLQARIATSEYQRGLEDGRKVSTSYERLREERVALSADLEMTEKMLRDAEEQWLRCKEEGDALRATLTKIKQLASSDLRGWNDFARIVQLIERSEKK